MKKNLNVTAAVLDLRKVSEETFASYEDIKLQAALVLTTPRVEALLAKVSGGDGGGGLPVLR